MLATGPGVAADQRGRLIHPRPTQVGHQAHRRAKASSTSRSATSRRRPAGPATRPAPGRRRFLGGRAVQRDPSRLPFGVTTDGSAAHVPVLFDEVDPTRRAVQGVDVQSCCRRVLEAMVPMHAPSQGRAGGCGTAPRRPAWRTREPPESRS